MTEADTQLHARAMALFEEALNRPSAERSGWLETKTAGAPDLRRLVRQMLAQEDDPSQIVTGQAALDHAEEPLPYDRIGAYRLTGRIGQGGMGTVYHGERDRGDFEHHVAIKVIRRGILSEALIERFERERQTLAAISHPNVARLFDGGTTDAGEPYIVMEYIDGAPITEWAEANNLSLKDRLSLFRDVCTAVAHAHQNLIIHRDLTPSNVLVTDDNQVKLIDFGIAKPVAAATQAEPPSSSLSGLSFTPGYAAPERSAGAAANTLSDVFSLGKLLAALLREVQAPADLKAIIARATQTEPAARYASVSLLARDIDQYQQRRPVSAFQASPLYQLRKFGQRQPVIAGLSGLLSVGLVLTTIITTGLYQKAQAERLAADRRFEEVRSLASFMMFDLYDELEKVPGNTKSIEMLARESQKYLDSLRADDRASMDVMLEAGRGYRRLADITGNPMIANLGKRDQAAAMLDEAVASLSDLVLQYPDEPDALRTLGEAAFSNSVHKFTSEEDNEGAVRNAELAVEAYEELAAMPGADVGDKRNLARARMMTGVPLPYLDREQEGLAILKQVRDEVLTLSKAYPDDTATNSFLGSINMEVARGIVRQETGSPTAEDALPYFDAAIEIRERMYQDNPDDARPYRSLVTMYYERGAWKRSLGTHDAALEDMRQSEEIARELILIDPDDAWLKRMLEGITDETAKTLSFAGRHEEATNLARTALRNNCLAFSGNEDNPAHLRSWAYSLVLHAEIFARAGEVGESCRLAEEARTAWTKVDETVGIGAPDRDGSLAQLAALEADC